MREGSTPPWSARHSGTLGEGESLRINLIHYLVKSDAVSFSLCANVNTMVTLRIKYVTERK